MIKLFMTLLFVAFGFVANAYQQYNDLSIEATF